MYKSGHNKLSDAVKGFKKKGTEGSLTRIAHSKGYSSPIKFARHVMADKKDYSPKTVKKANWAKNMNS